MFARFRNSASLELIHGPVEKPRPSIPCIELSADRFTLAKRRWRGTAADGREFGFDLERPLRHGDVFFHAETHNYVISQAPEAVLQVPYTEPSLAARTAWQVGNLHCPVAVCKDCLMIEDQPILRQMLAREGIVFTSTRAIFQPLGGAAAHTH